MWWALWWILTVLSALYTARRLWLSRPKELSLKDRADAITLIARVLDDQERKWLWWHWKLATDKHDASYVFQTMPSPTLWKEPEPAPRKVDPVPLSWRTRESTLTTINPFTNPERTNSEAKSSGGSSRPPDRWSDLVYRSSSPHR